MLLLFFVKPKNNFPNDNSLHLKKIDYMVLLCYWLSLMTDCTLEKLLKHIISKK